MLGHLPSMPHNCEELDEAATALVQRQFPFEDPPTVLRDAAPASASTGGRSPNRALDAWRSGAVRRGLVGVCGQWRTTAFVDSRYDAAFGGVWSSFWGVLRSTSLGVRNDSPECGRLRL